tara:strand:+ start:648 stop:1250 length:603 start_codon:yes stop_codon:yes gene_type:complete
LHLLIGLGNPEKKHRFNRHNIGFLIVDKIAQEFQFPPFRNRFKGLISENFVDGSNIKLLKPSTYMNNSGESIIQAIRFFKLVPSQIFVFYDDLDLSPGKCRIQLGGGTGGHNGLRNIEKHIGPDYWRVRIGIGHPGRKELVLAHVLNDFSEQEKNGWVETMLDSMTEHLNLLIKGDTNSLMSKIASTINLSNEASNVFKD